MMPSNRARHAAHGARQISNKVPNRVPNRAPKVAIQVAPGVVVVPRATSLRRWARAALAAIDRAGGLCIRVVDAPEMAELNKRFRHLQGTTNVLSFAADAEFPGGGELILGDVVICAPVVVLEAAAQHKTAEDHYAHLVIHGVLHLCGFDHENTRDAKVMEGHEVAILHALGIADPYRTGALLGHE
jgi:probable rRNA maturation factor